MVSFAHPGKNRLVSFDPGVFCLARKRKKNTFKRLVSGRSYLSDHVLFDIGYFRYLPVEI